MTVSWGLMKDKYYVVQEEEREGGRVEKLQGLKEGKAFSCSPVNLGEEGKVLLSLPYAKAGAD